MFNAETQWIVDQKANRNIQLVLHLGDIVDNNTTQEWQLAKNAVSTLDGQVPYILAGGNHDYGDGGDSNNRGTLMHQYFKASDNPLNDPAHGGIIKGFYEGDKVDNTYSTLTGPDGRKLLIFNLEFAPRQKVVDWAKHVASQDEYKDHTAILLTHAYMEEGPAGPDGQSVGIRSDWAKYGSSRPYNPHSAGLAKDQFGRQLTGADAVNDGQELWDDLVSQVGNFEITVSGHYLDENDSNLDEGGPATAAMWVEPGSAGQNVYQMVSNYQQMPNGGDGYIRLLEFLPDGETVQIKTYSPTLDRWLTDPSNQFTIQLSSVPEPGVAMLLIPTAAILLSRRR